MNGYCYNFITFARSETTWLFQKGELHELVVRKGVPITNYKALT